MTDFRKKIFAYVKKFASMLRSAECQLKPKTIVAARSAATFVLGFANFAMAITITKLFLILQILALLGGFDKHLNPFARIA
jgi:hypothetical protein